MKKRHKHYKLIVFTNRRNIHIYSHSYLPCSCFQKSLKYLTCSKFVVVLNDRQRYSEMTGMSLHPTYNRTDTVPR